MNLYRTAQKESTFSPYSLVVNNSLELVPREQD